MESAVAQFTLQRRPRTSAQFLSAPIFLHHPVFSVKLWPRRLLSSHWHARAKAARRFLRGLAEHTAMKAPLAVLGYSQMSSEL